MFSKLNVIKGIIRNYLMLWPIFLLINLIMFCILKIISLNAELLGNLVFFL